MRQVAFLAFGAMFIAGCTTLDNHSAITRHLRQQEEEAQAKMDAVKAGPTIRKRETVRYLQEQFVSLEPVLQKTAVRASSPLLRCRISIETVAPISMLEFAQTITRKCKVNVRVTPDAIAAVQNPLAADTGAVVPAIQGGAPSPMAPPVIGAQQATTAAGQVGMIDLNYSGELPGLLDTATSRWGVSWKEEDGKVKIYNVDTRVFHVHAFNSDTAFKADVVSGTTMVSGTTSSGAGSTGGGAGGSTSGGIGGATGSQQTTSVTLKMELWRDIIATVTGMRSAKGVVVGSPSTGTITVTDNEDVIARMDRYLTPLNAQLEKQVVFNVDLVSVELNDTDSLGLSFSALYQSLSQKYGFALASSFTAPANAVTGTFSILKNSGSPWSGTDAIVKALSEQGNVGLKRAPSATTLNLQTVSVQTARQTGFVPGATTTNTAQVGSTTTLQTGMVTTGLNMSLTPYVLEDNRMLVQFSINLSSLLNIRTVSKGDAFAEVPELNLPINMSQKVRLNPGETLMLSGFDDEDTNATQSGTLTPKNWLLGGGINATKRRTKLIVLITPMVLQ